MNSKKVFIDAFFYGLSGASIFDNKVRQLSPRIDFVTLPEKKTFADDWAAVGSDFKKVIANHEETTKRRTP